MTRVIPVGFADMVFSLQHADDPEPWSITFGIQTDLAAGSIEEHCNKVLADVTGAWNGVTSSLVTMGPVTGRFGQDGGPPAIGASSNTPQQGTASVALPPQNTALLVQKRTGFAGRAQRGRMYVPGNLEEGAVSGVGVITPAAVSTRQTAADDMLDALATDPLSNWGFVSPMVLLHSPPVVGATPDPTLVANLVVENLVATQRRRLRR